MITSYYTDGTTDQIQVILNVFPTSTPPTVTTAVVTGITPTTATGGGTVTSNGGAPLLAEGVCYGTSANPALGGNCTSDGTGYGAFVSSLTDLSAGQLYHVRAYATNSVGTGYGADVQFTTLFSSSKIGVFWNGSWYLDSNNTGAWEGVGPDTLIVNFGQGLLNAIPVTGDWDGSGTTKIGVFFNGTWYLDRNGDGVWDSGDTGYADFGKGLTGAWPVVVN